MRIFENFSDVGRGKLWLKQFSSRWFYMHQCSCEVAAGKMSQIHYIYTYVTVLYFSYHIL